MRYRRVFVAGGYYFFTVKLANPKSRFLVEHAGVLRAAFKWAKRGQSPLITVVHLRLPAKGSELIRAVEINNYPKYLWLCS
jgi:putative transposase